MIVQYLLPKENFFVFRKSKILSKDEKDEELSEITRLIEQSEKFGNYSILSNGDNLIMPILMET